MAAVGPGAVASPSAVALGSGVTNTVAGSVAAGGGGSTYAFWDPLWCTPAGKSPANEPRVIFSVNPTVSDTAFPSTTSLVANSAGNIIMPGAAISIQGAGAVTWTWDTASNLRTNFPNLFGAMGVGDSFRFAFNNNSAANITMAKTDATITIRKSNGTTASTLTITLREFIFVITRDTSTTFMIQCVGSMT